MNADGLLVVDVATYAPKFDKVYSSLLTLPRKETHFASKVM